MDGKSKLPKLSGLRPPQIKPLVEKQNLPKTENNLDKNKPSELTSRFLTHRLRRRSKSVTDLRPLQDKYPKSSKLHPTSVPSTKPEPLSTTSRTTLKRPATKCDDETKPKVIKQAKIPDWDFKRRFQQLNEKYTVLVETHKNLKAKTAEFQDIDERYNALQIEHDNIERNNLKLSSTNIDLKTENNTLKKINSDVKTELNSLSEKLSVLETKHNELVAKECEQAKELDRLKQVERDHLVLKINYEKLLTENTSLTSENDQLTIDNKKVKEHLSAKEDELEKLHEMVSMLKQDVIDSELLRRKLHNNIQDLKGNIRVFCRVRPPINEEEYDKPQCSVNCPDETTLEFRKSKESINAFTGKPVDCKNEFVFDRVFQPECTQAEFFEELSQLVQSALDGYDVCVFAYGQTGSGKTYTMQGLDEREHQGMVPRAIDLIFKTIETLSRSGWSYQVKVSFLEIYNESVRDLLDPEMNKNSLEILYNEGRGITVPRLKIEEIKSTEEFEKLLKVAQKNRMVAATNFNEHSSRSHAVYKIYLCGSNEDYKCSYSGSVNLVDLAGSERAKTSVGERLVETKSINSSLSALGTVMMALYNKEKHVPYRNSKLTYLLQSCLGGNSKTLMIVNISPFEEYYLESVTSLRFASKVKEVKNSIKRNKALLTLQASTSVCK